MKTVRVPTLLSFLAKIITFFSSLHHHRNLRHLLPNSTYELKHTYVFLTFLALSLCIVAIFLRGSSKRSSDNEDLQYHSISFFSLLELYPLSYKFDEGELDETHSLTHIGAEDDQEFIPRLVRLELIEGATGNHEDYKDSITCSVHAKLIEGDIESDDESEVFHGFDGYDEDNDDEGDEDDAGSIVDDDSGNNDLKIKVEEFISKTFKKWREEMLNDKVHYLKY